MFKQYFTDGLVQIAIVLSILRTDLNNLNREYVNYPEVQEIILGQTAAYTQTDFHINSINNRLGSSEIYRKNIDSEYLFSSSIYRELHSFRPQTNRDISIPTFLLVSGTSGPVLHSHSEVEENETEDENNNSIDNEQTLSSEDLELEAEHLLNTLEETIGAVAPNLNLNSLQGSEPTSEDLDLIEVLWRQDIDLGVGKEVFDPNLRRELEREREIELQKERQKQKEQELVQKKLEEQRNLAEQRWLADNFTQDGETGEWIPMGGSRVPPPPPAADLTNVGVAPEQFMSSFDNIPLMGDGLPQENSNNFPTPQAPPQYQGPQPMHQQSAPPMFNDNMGQYNQQLNNGNMVYRPGPQQTQMQCNMGQAFHQTQQQYNNTADFTHPQHNYTHVQNMSQPHTQPQQNQNYPRQSSLEATWQDLVNILDLPPNNQSRVASTGQRLMNGTGPNHSMPQMQNTSSMLIQNASMPTPSPMNGNVTFNNSGMVSQCHRTPPPSSGMLSPCGENFNSSMPSGSGMGSLDWESCGDLIFPNITSDLNDQAESIDDVDELLPDLITEDELEDINFAEMGLTDTVALTPTQGRGGDDASSDSAVSMGGSQSAGSPDMNDFSDTAMSPFDGLEGATGGHDTSQFPKTSKYDPDDFKYGNSCSYSSGGDSNGSNFSSSSNDTGGGGHYSHSGGGGCFSPGGHGHINHNHTYPLKPGLEPKDYSKKNGYNNNREGKHKGPQSKDHKRIEEMNVPFTVDQIVNSPVEEFNEMLTRHKFTDQQLQLIRDIRRRGKNKVAAQNCRKRKIGVIEHLEDEMTTMEKIRDKLLHERHLMEKQTREIKEKLGLLYSEIFHSLRDDHGQPYDPSRYSLQQSSDGDVFLVPRNYTTEDELSKKRKEERK